MDDVKDKFKGFMKKVSTSSSSKFQGQGRVLGSSSSSSTNPALARPHNPPTRHPAPPPGPAPRSAPAPAPPPRSPAPARRSEGFDPFDALITSTDRPPNGVTVEAFQCPVCSRSFRSENEVSEHVDGCLSGRVEDASVADRQPGEDGRSELGARVAGYLSARPPAGSVEVVLRLLGNIVREPGNDKYRRIRMSNSRIKEALGAAVGGVELLECVGFRLQEDGEEMWAVMDSPSDERVLRIREALEMLEPQKAEESSIAAAASVETPVDRTKIDRQVRVFFSAPENVAAKINLPNSFYNLSAQELKREADMRRKKIEESQLLIPKSYKEKQAKAARKRYKACLIRIQFPDGVLLQGVFLPWEPTTALYEFVSLALKEPSLEFELLQPGMPKRRVIPRIPVAGKKPPTLDDEDLVPSALIKFKPIETDSVVFLGLRNDLLLNSEPLTSETAVAPP